MDQNEEENNNNIFEENVLENDNKKNNKDLLNIQSSLNIKKFEQSNFFYFMSLNRKSKFPDVIEYILIIIEAVQFLSIFYNTDYLPTLPHSLDTIFSTLSLRNVIKSSILFYLTIGWVSVIYTFLIIHFVLSIASTIKFPEILLKINAIFIKLSYKIMFIPIVYSTLDFFDCSKNKNDKDAKYICFNSDHYKVLIGSLTVLVFFMLYSHLETTFAPNYIPLSKVFGTVYSYRTFFTYRIIVLIEILNLYLFQIYFNIPLISSIIMFAGFAYLLYDHYNSQIYHSKKLNCYYSSLWFSMVLQTFVYIFFATFKIKKIYPIFIGICVIGLVAGWFLNILYSNWYTNKIFTNIERKYNQRHVIDKLKEQIEMEHIDDDERKSIETIVTEKRVIKKENVYKKFSDCGYVSKFIMDNRSISAFYLVNSLFKEGVLQFEREPMIYMQYWNFLHGMRRFLSINRICFASDEFEEITKKIDRLSEKVLMKCANMANGHFMKYLVYNAIYIYEMDKSLIINNENSGDNGTTDFELLQIKNKSIQYHISALNELKELMTALKTLENPADIDNAMVINDHLTEVLNSGEKHFKHFVTECNYSKESLELYILFLRNSMNRGDLAGQFIQMLDENENCDKEEINNKYGGYEKSEKMSSSMNSDVENRKTKILKKNMLSRCQQPLYKLLNVMQILTTLAILIGIVGNYIYINSFSNVISTLKTFTVEARAPVIMSQIQSAVRLIGLTAGAGFSPYGMPFVTVIQDNLDYLKDVYFPIVYKDHDTTPKGFLTIHPVANGVVDELKDVNFFQLLEKMYRKSQLIIDSVNRTDILTPEYNYDRDIRFFQENAKGEFESIFLRALDENDITIENTVIRHERMFYVILGIISLFMIFCITKIIIPNTNKSHSFIKDIVCLYKTLPSKYFYDQSNEYSDQIQEICENYEVDDEGMFKNSRRRKTSSTKSVKIMFLTYCVIIAVLLLFPFITVFLYKSESKSLIKYLVNSSKRNYYLAQVNMIDMEMIFKDRYYFSEGQELAIMSEIYEKLVKLENGLKSGAYGGKTNSDYPIFDEFVHNPTCFRGKTVKYQYYCDSRSYDDLYTKDLSESSTDYLMVEYLNKLSEYIANPPQAKYDVLTVEGQLGIFLDIVYSPYVQFLKKMSDDISGHIDLMNEIGADYLESEALNFQKITLLTHVICSLLIFITFFIFVSRPIKKQLRVIDSLTNITFSIPSTIYNSSPKIKNFIENGKLEE